MAKLRFWLSLVSKLIIGMIAGVALFVEVSSFGTNAWRLLETWWLLVATGYFLFSALVEWFYRKQAMPHRSFCSLLQGMIIVVGVGLGILRVFYDVHAIEWPGSHGFLDYLWFFGISILAIGDWLCFTKKGSWSLSYPWYWLGIIISYCCVILLTADFVSGQEEWVYPYYFLNYSEFGVDNLLLWVALMSVVVLVIGYTLMLLDYTMSGQLNQHIVMPKIKTIIIEEPLAVEPEVVTQDENTEIIQESKPDNTKPKVEPKPKSKVQPSMDVVRPVEGLKDRKSAQKIHHANKNSKSKSEIIADMRLQVTGNKSQKSRQRATVKPNSKIAKKS